MKLFTGFSVLHIVFYILCNTTSSVTNSSDRCARPWKSDFGLTSNTTEVTGSLLGLQNIIIGHLSDHEKDDSMMTHLDKCSKSIDCRLSTILDKKKTDVMYLCIEVEGSDICYTSNCTCQKKRGKRMINSKYVQNKTGNEDKISGRDNYKLHCEFRKLNGVYSQDKPVNTFCQNVTCTGVDIQKGLEEGSTTSVQEECLYKNRKNKDTNTSMNVLYFFGGTLFGLFLGVFVTKVYFKRKSKQPKVLSVRNMVYKGCRISNEEFTFKEIAEYSEIPDKYSNIEVADALPPKERRKSVCEQGRDGSEIDQHANMHTSKSMIEQENSCCSCLKEKSYPQKSFENLKSEEYLEPTICQYHKLSPMESAFARIERKVDKDGVIERNKLVNGKGVANQSGLQNEQVNQYKILYENSTENREIYLPQETKDETSDLCNFNDEVSEKEPAYFVLSKVQVN